MVSGILSTSLFQGVSLSSYLVLSAILFTVGVVGFMTRRNIIVIFMSIELMLNAANLAFVAFSRFLNSMDGQIFVFFVMSVAAAEAAVGLAIIIALYRTRETVNADEVNLMKW
jgi:NADH-quinone oxidoreductase subunit K